MAVVLGVATLLGGIAALWYFWDKIAAWFRHAPAIPPEPDVLWVDLNYPADSGLQARLNAQGYRLVWAREDQLTRLIRLEGWETLIEPLPDGRRQVFKIKDPIADLTLLRRRIR
jgi:hypothetical protein